MAAALSEGRICDVAWQPEFKVHTAWDLGRTDDTAIWWYQQSKGEIHVLDHWAGAGCDVPDLATIIHSKPYKYGNHWFPHDARMKTLAANGRSIIEQMHSLGVKGQIVPNIGVQDGIQAVRAMMPVVYFDQGKCEAGMEALRSYQREWDADKRAFRDTPRHDWASHSADAFRMLAVAWREENPAPAIVRPMRGIENATFDEALRMKPRTYSRSLS